MYLEIISPEKIIFKGDIVSISAPGVDGMFQILNNHAPIVSSLKDGEVKFEVANKNSEFELSENDITKNGNIFSIKIEGGVFEFNNNKATILSS